MKTVLSVTGREAARQDYQLCYDDDDDVDVRTRILRREDSCPTGQSSSCAYRMQGDNERGR